MFSQGFVFILKAGSVLLRLRGGVIDVKVDLEDVRGYKIKKLL